jgi:LysR family glycine cleavage system transcriptional activator
MHNGLPSLDLIRVFEAAGRHLSFTRAGRELFITQSAVSRSIKTLEEHLGVPLFQRRHRALLLTEAGQRLYRTATQMLEQLTATLQQIRASEAQTARSVTVTSAVSFAAMWLVPRLPEFREKYPRTEVRIAANNELLDLDRENMDVAVRYCAASFVPPGTLRLFGETVFPVCSPQLLEPGRPPLKRPEDLQYHILLHQDDPDARSPWLQWNVWFEVMKLKNITPAGVLRFSHYDHLIQAAMDGQGVALGRSPLVPRLIEQKRLVAPLDQKSVSSRSYYVLSAEHSKHRTEVKEFIAWLEETARLEGG